jgi:hypothetical protein
MHVLRMASAGGRGRVRVAVAAPSGGGPWDDVGMVEERISGTLAVAVTPLRDAGERLGEDAFAPLL